MDEVKEPYTGPERRTEVMMSKDDHTKVCAASERKLNERFGMVYERLTDGSSRMSRIEGNLMIMAQNIEKIEQSMSTSSKVVDDRMDRIDAGLQQNTAVTQEVKDILDTAKGAFRVFGWMGNALKWTLGLGAAALGFWVALKDFRVH